jgi:hypothetical protein
LKNNAPIANTPQTRGVRYSAPQNTVLSKGCTWNEGGRDSNFHSFVPSAFTSFHHRRPTSKRPLTFLTVQKSQARRITHVTNTDWNGSGYEQTDSHVSVGAACQKWRGIRTTEKWISSCKCHTEYKIIQN